jgi:hypothetical protein
MRSRPLISIRPPVKRSSLISETDPVSTYPCEKVAVPGTIHAAAIAEAKVDPDVMWRSATVLPTSLRSRAKAGPSQTASASIGIPVKGTPGESKIRIEGTAQRSLHDNVNLAKDLGATTICLRGSDVAKSLAGFAREYGVTHAIFGAPEQSDLLERIRHLFRPDGVTRFTTFAPEVDVHICGRRAVA